MKYAILARDVTIAVTAIGQRCVAFCFCGRTALSDKTRLPEIGTFRGAGEPVGFKKDVSCAGWTTRPAPVVKFASDYVLFSDDRRNENTASLRLSAKFPGAVSCRGTMWSDDLAPIRFGAARAQVLSLESRLSNSE